MHCWRFRVGKSCWQRGNCARSRRSNARRKQGRRAKGRTRRAAFAGRVLYCSRFRLAQSILTRSASEGMTWALAGALRLVSAATASGITCPRFPSVHLEAALTAAPPSVSKATIKAGVPPRPSATAAARRQRPRYRCLPTWFYPLVGAITNKGTIGLYCCTAVIEMMAGRYCGCPTHPMSNPPNLEKGKLQKGR